MKLAFFHFSELSQKRSKLMGVASLMIIMCHASASNVLMPDLLSRLLDLGIYGVDIFLFLSGLGLYYSFKKNPITPSGRGGYVGYFKRRYYRVLIPYWIVYIPYCIVFFFLGWYTIGDSLLCLGSLEYWFYHRGAWFVSLILILYLFAPILFKALKSRYKWLYTIGIICLIMALCQMKTSEPINTSINYNIQFVLSRVPSFVIGMALGQMCQESKSVSSFWLIILALCGLLFMKYLPQGTCAIWMEMPLLLFLIDVVLKCSEKVGWLDKALVFMGGISLESYLMNISLNSLLGAVIKEYGSSAIFYGRYLQYSIVIFIGTIAAFYVNRFVKSITEESFRNKQ